MAYAKILPVNDDIHKITTGESRHYVKNTKCKKKYYQRMMTYVKTLPVNDDICKNTTSE